MHAQLFEAVSVAAWLALAGGCATDPVGDASPFRPRRGAVDDDTTDDTTDDDTAGDTAGDPGETPVHRVLLVIADDLSAATTPMYADDFPDPVSEVAALPTLQAICDEGVRFRNAWSAPSCSPTRATLLTGRYNFRSDSLDVIGNDMDGIALEEPTLPRLFAAAEEDIALANIGKWNLGRTDELGGAMAPNTMGWQHYAGLLDAAPLDYLSWSRTEDGVTEESTDYITSRTVDDAITWLDDVGPQRPWVLWLAFNAPHAPFHLPPLDLHDYDELSDDPAAIMEDPGAYQRAMTQAMDTELGRLLAWLEANGHADVDVIFVGDNGDDDLVHQEEPWLGRSKGTTYWGGVNVPLCVAGPGVAEGGRVVDDLVSTVDALATITELMGLPVDQTLAGRRFDSVSFAPRLGDPTLAPARTWIYTEGSATLTSRGESWAVRNADHKLMRFIDEGREELYDLDADPYEQADLLAATPKGQEPTLDAADTAALAALQAVLADLRPDG